MAKRTIPLLPLRGILVFPYMIIHLDVGREKSISALEEAMVQDRLIMLATQKDAQNDTPEPEDIFSIGTVAEIKQLLKLPGGTIRVLVEGLHRAEIEEFVSFEPFYQVAIQEFTEVETKTPEIEALTRTVINQFEQWVKLSKKIPPETLVSVVVVEEPGRLSDLIASHLSLKIEDKQALLDAVSANERLEKLCEILGREMEILELEKKIHVRVRKQMEKTQKEYYLREQLKAIQKELGEKDDRSTEVEEYRQRLEEQKLPKEVAEKISKEIDRLEKMPPMVAESGVIRTYLDWLLSLPWTTETNDRLDINLAEEILEEDHYGLEKVKERILEYLSIRKLTEKMKGPILCLVGPPGVGKTSLARSIARSMERKFVRVSLGGVRDEAEIRGHRRTYVGALPGRIIQGMRTVGTKNPVFLLDEIDKMSADFRGDPSAALLEVLDPEQNNSFSDHYVELPFDLSRVLWVVTANIMHNIPRPLLDRMELITIAGYTEEEKIEIAKRYLVPKQTADHGLTNEQIIFSEGTIQKVIRDYTREAGVRNLERNIANLCRKVARRIVQGKGTSIKITAQNLHTFLGAPKFRHTQAERTDQIGVATGLAWTEVGGDVLAVEISTMKGKGKLTLTGQLGEVMQESAQAGFSYIRSRSAELGIDEEFYEKMDIHIHLPEGAIPKDGPSAGITMATAIASALTGKPVRSDLAMTGEITLRGRVLPVGGIKEKVLAAHRVGIKKVMLPKENKRDLDEIPANVKRSVEFIWVEHMDEVLKAALVSEG
ncbi:MAG TPA: endopeptidase La [Methylomusa anaerophila]|uniref:Lon protease n=1 Tax=Methylomusa anaerophila TaxID=1930071 RepID=A0A348AFL2_9FIRM|nr:endopeptidase La [Methylomusa anaerophila]BBB89860.1 Lon protease 1 [Methylomusa anaerophila]HML89094.1 endopeptidase La [Methylomusa anaerophila]